LDSRRFLLLNIKAKPSKLFVGDAEPAEGEEPAEGGGEPDFTWHAKTGLAGNI